MRLLAVVILVLGALPASVVAQMDYRPPADLEALHRPYDELLDEYVRDGIVYYHALKIDHVKLDRYVASLAAVSGDTLGSWDRARQIAFWINAYDALALQTAVNHYPAGMRQVPGGYDQIKHVIAGRTVTLDQIENRILADYHDPRIYLVLGRAAMGSGRLRSEAFSGPRLESQLEQSAQQFVADPKYIHVDPLNASLGVSPLFSWREKAFIDTYADKSPDLPGRTPLERAIVGFIEPYLLPAERQYLQKNTFKLAYMEFDWTLNDRAGIRH
jgi:Protein of unknown function, DUF547